MKDHSERRASVQDYQRDIEFQRNLEVWELDHFVIRTIRKTFMFSTLSGDLAV